MKNLKFAQAGYHMLMIMAVVDGSYAVAEGKVIVDFIMSQVNKHPELDDLLDMDKENQSLLEVPKDSIADHYKINALYMLEYSTEEERLDFLAYLYRVIEADGRIAPEEKQVFISTCHVFGVDAKVFFQAVEINTIINSL